MRFTVTEFHACGRASAAAAVLLAASEAGRKRDWHGTPFTKWAAASFYLAVAAVSPVACRDVHPARLAALVVAAPVTAWAVLVTLNRRYRTRISRAADRNQAENSYQAYLQGRERR